MEQGDAPATRWLDEEEMAAWLPLVRLLTTLPHALDTQLREEAGISHLYYQVLVMLSQAPDGALRMSELARSTGMSLSRLSRAVASLEERGWLERRPCPDDRRGQVAHLLEPGRRTLEAAAPGHVAEVRRRVFDHLSREQVGALRAVADLLLAATRPDT